MAQDIEPAGPRAVQPIGPAGPEWAPEPQIVTPVSYGGPQALQPFEWAGQLRPPAQPGTSREKFSKAVTPIRAVALFILWLTWSPVHVAGVGIVVGLIVILITIK